LYQYLTLEIIRATEIRTEIRGTRAFYGLKNKEISNFVYDFKQEIIKYLNDVDILRRACMAFRKIFLKREDVCPFVE